MFLYLHTTSWQAIVGYLGELQTVIKREREREKIVYSLLKMG